MLAHLKDLLTQDECKAMREALSAAPFEDGKLTALGAARLQKNNLQLNPAHPRAQESAQLIHKRLASSDSFSQVAWPRRIQTFRFCRYEKGMYYGDHVDLPSMGEGGSSAMRTDLSITVFLSPLEDYDGGELVLQQEMAAPKIRGAPGDALVYPSNMVHRVEPVTRGQRLVAVSWVESRIRDEKDRRFLFEMGRSLVSLERRMTGDSQAAADLLRLRNCMYQLTRRWLD